MEKYQNISLTGKYENGGRNNTKTICAILPFRMVILALQFFYILVLEYSLKTP
jgi:hypothetical protein